MRGAIFLLFTSILLMGADVKELYKKCAGCHGEDGKHKAFNRSDIIGGRSFDFIFEKLKFFKEGDFPSQSTSRVMKKQLKDLNEEELKELAEYISNLK